MDHVHSEDIDYSSIPFFFESYPVMYLGGNVC